MLYRQRAILCALSLGSSRSAAWVQPSHQISSRKILRQKSSLFVYQNNLLPVSSLQNEYFALRHGQSKANVAKIIASSPEIACTNYGLSPAGKDQAIRAGQDVVQRYQEQTYQGVLILASDLLRAKETAETVAEAVQKASIPLYNNGVVIETRLRERGFGEWDGGSDEHYNDVWKDDAIDPTHTIQGVESVVSVMDRSSTCVLEWDIIVQNYFVICVAHGDVLQMLQTSFSKMDGSKHRTLDHLETATLRPLLLAPN